MYFGQVASGNASVEELPRTLIDFQFLEVICEQI